MRTNFAVLLVVMVTGCVFLVDADDCLQTEFSCSDGKMCVHETWVCDGDPDCDDESDEKYCYPKNYTTHSPAVSSNVVNGFLNETVPRISNGTFSSELKCVPLIVPQCLNLGYNMTIVHNQTEAMIELRGYESQLNPGTTCPTASLYEIWCAVLATPCSKGGHERKLCRSVCQRAQQDSKCSSMFRRNSQMTRKLMNLPCNELPRGGENASCWTASTHPRGNETSPVTVRSQLKCFPLIVPQCLSLGYNMTIVRNQTAAIRKLRELERQIHPDTKCSKTSVYAVFCDEYATPCVEGRYDQILCRSVCQRAQRAFQCSSMFRRNSQIRQRVTRWLCDQLPRDGGNASCWKPTNVPITPHTDTLCQRMAITTCSSAGYQHTKLPNMFMHKNQNQVRRAISLWSPVLLKRCSSLLNGFLCRIYAPTCRQTKIPCRSVCRQVKKECHSVMRRLKIKWPTTLRCSQLPKKKCIGAQGIASTNSRKPKTTRATQTAASTEQHTSHVHVCQNLKIPACSGLGYNITVFPNIIGHRTQKDASLEVNQFQPLIKIGCAKHLRQFLCSMYAPVCTILEKPLPPCRSLCEHARSGCGGILRRMGFSWPAIMKCSRFPVFGDELCVRVNLTAIGTTIKTTTVQPTSVKQTTTKTPPTTTTSSHCERVTTPICQDMGYNLTAFPNMLGHRTQEGAAKELQQFLPLIKVGCSKHIARFLCSTYMPMCSANVGVVIPCRSLCEKARDDCSPIMAKFGFRWFHDCSRFPQDRSKHMCIEPLKFPTTKTPTHAQIRPTTPTQNSPKCGSSYFTSSQGSLTSPNYPLAYPNEIRCQWKISLPESYKTIVITIEKMRLEEDRNCFYDYIMIKDKMLNQVGRRHCGTYRRPYQLPVIGNEVTIVFVSDKNTAKSGFTLKYKGLVSEYYGNLNQHRREPRETHDI